jgi:uncharacterized protein with FMN-binding domain
MATVRVQLNRTGKLCAILLLFPLSLEAATQPPANPTPTQAAPAGKANAHTRAEIEEMIQKAGQAPPEWFGAVTPNYPQTLDLAWGDPKGRNAQKDLKEYIWSVINPNPPRWREGVKLLHQVLSVNKDNPPKLRMTMNALAESYHNFFGDYARAAFWWRKAEAVDFGLADCYWKMGNKDMAKEVLEKYGFDDTRQCGVIKLWADIGEIDTALKMANDKASTVPDAANFVAGDCLRLAGRYKEALDYYGKVLNVQAKDTQTAAGRLKWNQDQARTAIDAIKLFDSLDLKRIADGTYNGTVPGYSGQLTVAVTVKSAKIDAVKVTQQTEHQAYLSLTATPERIIQKQSVKGVDTYSSATVTSNAIINASAKALASGVK